MFANELEKKTRPFLRKSVENTYHHKAKWLAGTLDGPKL